MNNRIILCPFCQQSQSKCTHRHGAPFAVEKIATKERGTFPTAHDVAMYMWGRDFAEYRVFRYGVLFSWAGDDLKAFERALEGTQV